MNVIKLKTYYYIILVKSMTIKDGKKATEMIEERNFVTLNANADPKEMEKALSKSYRQEVKLVLDKEFEIKRPLIKLDPRTDSMYNHEPTEEELNHKEDSVIDMPIDLNIGDEVNHPILGHGVVVDYEAHGYEKYEPFRRPAPSFYYVIQFDDDFEIDRYTGQEKPFKRTFTPRSLYEALNRPVENEEQVEA